MDEREDLTAEERSFLLEHTDLTAEDLTRDARAATQVRIAHDSAHAEATVEESALTTSELAELLGRAEANVRRSRLNGDLYSPGHGAGGRTPLFPRWQITRTGMPSPGCGRSSVRSRRT